VFHVHTLHGFFNVSTWITAVVGAAILLLISRVANGRPGQRVAHR
jgi:uncharacterized membrane protein YeaQ/YmgE (transglycosylase-associated protein family)